MEHEANVPESEDGEKGATSAESGTAGAEELSGAIEKNRETKNEKWSERDEKAVAVGRDAGPIGITGDEKIKRKKGHEKGSASTALPPPENKKADDSEEKNRRP